MTQSSGQIEPEHLPYRSCVGIVLINREGLVWLGRRRAVITEANELWQMPQGGIDRSEEPSVAAMRELAEETGTDKAEIIGQSSDWLTYTFPPELIGIVLKGRYRGQKQRWFAMRFLGADSDFNIHAPAGGHPPEFDDWRWASPDEVVKSIVLFKRDVYSAVMYEFRALLK